MANPPKKKGTGAETELVRLFESQGLAFTRMPASSTYDLTNADPGRLELEPIEALATRPDRGQWLVTIRQEDFAELLAQAAASQLDQVWETHVEVKRYARFSLHTIFDQKFGGKR
ncbi:MAG: hypothetical protein V4510_12775 [bacterium]